MTGGPTRAGYIGLVGRPNVGKSTLLNRLIGQKISITAPKPQTTRHNILGILTHSSSQLVFVDTPGINLRGREALNRHLNRSASAVLEFVDVVVLLVQALRWTEQDDAVLRRLQGFPRTVVLAINQVDRVKPKAALLPYLREVAAYGEFAEIVPISARTGGGLDVLLRILDGFLPESSFLFPEDQVTNVSQRFLAAEIVREKLTRALHQELPYSLTVEVEHFQVEEGRLLIHAIIWVERVSQKAIVIGDQGSLLKELGRQARLDMKREFGCPVHLRTWVKVREGWADSEQALRSLGYLEQP